ncbi:MAG: PilZ domain-containing protein, partial [Desulfuromonadales bacterium]|nr:PilZ domain-containing protein [Desulfuromonadales bacterium]
APPEAKDEGAYGYVQVHKTGSQVPVSNDGRFEIGDEKEAPAAVAVTVSAIERPISTPYSGTSPVVEQKVPDEVVVSEPQTEPTIADKAPAIETSAKVAPVVQTADKKSASIPSAETADAATPVEKVSDPASTVAAQLDPVQMGVILVLVVVVVFGSIFISRSAAKRAVKAEMSVVVPSAVQKQTEAPVDLQIQIDRAYEQEVFDDLEKVSAAEKGGDGLIEREVPPPKAETVAVVVSGEQELRRPEPDLKSKAGGVIKKGLQSKTVDGGNFTITPDDYDRLMHPPKREPRVDCLFEVTCRLDGRTITGISLDISSGGLFIDSKEKITSGKIVELEFRLNEEDPLPIFCRGVVAWVNERPNPIKVDYPNGFGVCFLDMESAAEKLIAAFLYPTAVDAVAAAEEEHDS